MIREERKKKKRKKFTLTAFLAVLILLTIAALVVIRVFRVTNVEVKGNELYDAQVIEDTILNDEYSWNSLYVFLKYRFTEPDSIPFIDTMEISLKNPKTLTISVYEKGMMGYLYIPAINENAYFDKDGFVVETSSEVIPGVPQVDGLSCDQVVLYEKLPIEDDILKELLALTQALKKYDKIPDSIHYGSASGAILNYGTIQVYIGDIQNLTPKMERLIQIMPSLEGQAGILHMEKWTEESTNIVFDRQE